MGSKPKAPAPLDVDKVAGAQNAQNTQNIQQQEAYNRVDQTDALGNSLNYTQTGTDANGNPTFAANQQYGQTGQDYASGLAGLGQQYFQGASEMLGNRPDMSSNAAFDRAYGAASANLEPRFARASDAMETKLKNQGLDPGSEAYRNASNDLALQQNEARNNLVTQLQGQMFNQGLQDRNQQVGELSSLTSPGVQFANKALTPAFANTPGINVPNVDLTALYNQQKNQQIQNYNAEMQQYGGMMGGLAGLGGTIAGAALGGPIGASLGNMMMGAPSGYGSSWDAWVRPA